jgi:hypothetical protein
VRGHVFVPAIASKNSHEFTVGFSVSRNIFLRLQNNYNSIFLDFEAHIQTWTKFNERLNDLANQGYLVSFTTDKYVLFSRKIAATRREE